MRASLRVPFVLSALALSLPGQEPPPDVKNDPRRAGGARGAAQAGEEAGVVLDDGARLDELGVEKPVQPRRRSPQGFCTFVTSVSPNRVLPGTGGTLIVTMLLQGDAVLTAPPPVRFSHESEQGPFQVGAPSFRPAKRGYLSDAFRGQLVYDNYAIFEVPFEVKQGTPFQEFRLAAQIEFELHNGKTGQPIDTFFQRVATAVEVGVPTANVPLLPASGDPAAGASPEKLPGAGSESSAANAAGPAGAEPNAAGRRDPVADSPGGLPGAIGAAIPAAEGAPETVSPVSGARSETEDLSPPESGDLPWLLVGLAGGLLLVGLLLLRRR